MIFETHAHYDERAFDSDREELLAALPENGIGGVVNISASWRGLQETLSLMERYPFIYGAIGIHPDSVGELTDERMDLIAGYCDLPKTVAVGEIGLDYHWDVEPRDMQKYWFVRQLHLAIEKKLPVVIHSRDAARDTFDIMKKEHAGHEGGIIHCFSGSAQMAVDYVRLGYHIGVGGVVTFKNGRVLKEVVKAVPIERIVVETDCPYLAPVPFRGKRNSSLYLPYIIKEIASLKGLTPEETEAATFKNALDVYRLSVPAEEHRS